MNTDTMKTLNDKAYEAQRATRLWLYLTSLIEYLQHIYRENKVREG